MSEEMTFEQAEEQIKVAKEKNLCPICLKPKDVCLEEVEKRNSWYCDG